MNKLKIALVYDAIYPYIMGGGEKRFFELAKRLSKSGYEVHLYGMKFWDGPPVIERDGIYLHGLCKARSLYNDDGKRVIGQAVVFGISCIKLLKEDFDVIDCCGFPYFSLFSCKLVCTLKRKPLYSTWHEVWGRNYWDTYLGRLGFIGNLIEQTAAHLPNVFIAVSDHTKEQMLKTYNVKKPIKIIENGIDTEEIRSIEPSKHKSDVVYVGRLMDFKHIDVLIDSISLLLVKYPGITATIIGGGPEQEALEQKVAGLGLQKHIIFTGKIDEHKEVIARVKASKIFVLPSTREGFGMVVLEANAAGVPVVTVDVPTNAARDLVTSKSGRTTALDAAKIAQCIDEVLANPIAKDGCIDAARKYEWKALALKLEAVLA